MTNYFEETPHANSHQEDTELAANNMEIANSPVDSLLERLKFIPTAELTAARDALIAGLSDETADPSTITLVWGEYAQISEELVAQTETDNTQPDAYINAQIAAIIHKAGIFAAVGKTDRYLEELDTAEAYAYNLHLDDVSDALQAEISNVLETLDAS